jgi:hypothetical protein
MRWSREKKNHIIVRDNWQYSWKWRMPLISLISTQSEPDKDGCLGQNRRQQKMKVREKTDPLIPWNPCRDSHWICRWFWLKVGMYNLYIPFLDKSDGIQLQKLRSSLYPEFDLFDNLSFNSISNRFIMRENRLYRQRHAGSRPSPRWKWLEKWEMTEIWTGVGHLVKF